MIYYENVVDVTFFLISRILDFIISGQIDNLFKVELIGNILFL